MDSTDANQPEEQGHPSRREFLTRAGLMAGGVAILGIPGFKSQIAVAALATDTRAYATSRFGLELDGQVFPLKSSEGGFPKSDVIQELVGPSQISKKHLAPPKYQDIILQCDPFMPKPLSDWVNATLAMNYVRKSGAIITGDFDYKERSRQQFNNAMITEIGFPPCNAGSKDAGYLTLKLTPEYTKMQTGSGALMKIDAAKVQQKVWLSSNFRLKIQGLEEACKYVNKIESLVIKQTIAQDQVGQLRDYQKQPGKVEFPNLVITLSEGQAGPFYGWFEDMVINGNAGEDRERPGILEFLTPDLSNVLFAINFSHLGIFSFAPEKLEANADAIRRVKVEMYCEQITIGSGKG